MRRLVPMFMLAAVSIGGNDPLVDRMNTFAKTYNEFAMVLRSGGFDVRLAKKLSREWRDVEASGEWPK